MLRSNQTSNGKALHVYVCTSIRDPLVRFLGPFFRVFVVPHIITQLTNGSCSPGHAVFVWFVRPDLSLISVEFIVIKTVVRYCLFINICL